LEQERVELERLRKLVAEVRKEAKYVRSVGGTVVTVNRIESLFKVGGERW
jgi:hypothetical protein